MYKIVFLLCIYILSHPLQVKALAPPSYSTQHPLAWMHALPVGETPGWTGSFWFNYQINQVNIWNPKIDLKNSQNDFDLSYTADYGQTSNTLEIGFSSNKYFSHSFVLPYASRNGGILDRFIDDFHVAIGIERFDRENHPENQSNLTITENNITSLHSTNVEGLGNFVYKFKFWPWQIIRGKGSCPCGLSTSLQVKIPTTNADSGLTTGDVDSTAMINLGFPIFKQSAIWMSSAVTHLQNNKFLAGWPRRTWHQMYEVASDFAINKNWGVLFTLRMESPFVNKDYLSVVNNTSDTDKVFLEKVSTSWNSLVHWRGTENLGIRYRSNSGTKQFNLMIIEDWAFAYIEGVGDKIYVNNAPDVGFTFQFAWAID